MKNKYKMLYDKLLCLEEIRLLRENLKISSGEKFLIDKMGIRSNYLKKLFYLK